MDTVAVPASDEDSTFPFDPNEEIDPGPFAEAPEPASRTMVTPMGYDHGTFYYFSTATRQIAGLRSTEHTRAHLCGLAPSTYWERHQEFWTKSGFGWNAMADHLMTQCRDIGIYDPERVRGRGAWMDGDDVILHLGHALVRGAETLPVGILSRYIYEVSLPLVDAADLRAPLSNAEAHWLAKICQCLRWERRVAGRLLAGWIALAPICGAIEWRPSIWLTGASGSGKTWVVRQIVQRVLGRFSLHVALNTSEPALRRMLRADARPVVFDEIERDTPGAYEQIPSLLGLLRQASSENGAVVAKASGDGGYETYRCRTMFCLQSINTSLRSQADMSRVEVLSLRDSSRPGDVAFADLKAAVAERLTEDFGLRLLSRTIGLVPVIRQNAITFADAIAAMAGKTQRQADQIGTLLAGAYSLHATGLITSEAATAYVAHDEWLADMTPTAETRDEYQLLATLLAANVRVDNRDVPISRLIEACQQPSDTQAGAVDFGAASIALRDVGIAVGRHGDRLGVFVSTSHPSLRRILRGTPWDNSWGASLGRLPGAAHGRDAPTRRFGLGFVTRAVFLPIETIGGAD